MRSAVFLDLKSTFMGTPSSISFRIWHEKVNIFTLDLKRALIAPATQHRGHTCSITFHHCIYKKHNSRATPVVDIQQLNEISKKLVMLAP